MKGLWCSALATTLFACGTRGGPVTGPADAHCGTRVVTVDPNQCAARVEGIGVPAEEVHDGTEADDDDCKYRVTWSSTAVEQRRDVAFTLTLVNKSDGKAVAGAVPSVEAYLTPTHPAPNPGPTATEGTPGTYKIQPLRFDAKGKWIVRFHFFGGCTDSETSPHGHAAFFVDVP